MRSAFASIAFNELSAAEANLAILETRLSPKLWAALPTLLAQVPSPDDALNFLERYLREAPASVTRHLEAHPAALHYLLSLFSYSRFLSESLVQQPDLLLWLDHRNPTEGLERRKSRDDLLEDCYRFSTMAYDLSPAILLARFKRREYLRITLRDVLNLATLADTVLELSDLADVLIERALRLCAQRLENTYGVPQWSDATGHFQPARLTVLSLGKLGGQELNYSSDIDLIFLYDHDGETAGGTSLEHGGAISNLEYFVRLTQAILKLLTDSTPEGAVFRVDLRLRPEGQQGDIAVSLNAALDYYRARAREWELQMLIKARVSAGELATGEKFLREVHALIYRPEFHFAAVEAVANAREEISRSLRRGNSPREDYAAEWNVKLSPGGIRDIEFLTQCLQRIHGGRDAWLTGRRSGSTLVALQHLHDKGYLSQRDFFRLSAAYQFLRKVEHRLQLRDGLQEHTLPRKPGALDRIARRCGIGSAGRVTPADKSRGEHSPGEELLRETRAHFEEVRAIYERVLPSDKPDEADWPANSERALNSVFGGADPLMARLRPDYLSLAEQLTHYRRGENVLARRGVEKFLDAALFAPALLRKLDEHPDWLDHAAQLFSLSDFATEMLMRDPHAIRHIAEDEGASAPQLPFQSTFSSLRVNYREAGLRAAARSLLGKSKPFDTFAALTEATENAVRAAFAIAARQEMPSAPEKISFDDAPFAVIALGRLGTHEFDIGSDADVVFIADCAAGESEIHQWRRVAEHFLHVAGSYTSDGLLLPLDTRLRPRGGEGEIVQSASYVLDYFSRDAEGWEAATYLKARPVAGNIALGEKILVELRGILQRRYSSAHDGDSRELARQLVHTRAKLEQERHEGASGFKSCAGGFFDIDYIVAYLKLSRGLVAEAPANFMAQIAFLEARGALDSRQAETLRAAAMFYRSLDHAIRLVLGHPSAELPEPAQISRVNALLEKWGVPIFGELHGAVTATRKMVREIYEGVVRQAE
ncbi:MAG: [protein-PII] uridylyltransferase family protein [Candidatus Acidiferrales bacterium]